MAYNDRDMARPGQPTPGVQGPIPAKPSANVGMRRDAVAPAAVAPVATTPVAAPMPAPQAAEPKSAKIVTPGIGVRANDMNAFYTQQGYGAGTTEPQVTQALGQRNAADSYGDLFHPPAPTPVAPVKIGMKTTPASAPAADHVRASMMAQHNDLVRNHPFYSSEQDIANHRNAVMHSAGALSLYDKNQAEIQQGDSVKQLGNLSKMDPAARALYLASKGVDTATIQSLPQAEVPGSPPRFDISNYDSAGAVDPRMSGASAILAGDTPIHEKAAAFAAFPGIENPSSPHRQLWDGFMARQQARGDAHNQEMGWYNPADPTHRPIHNNWFHQIVGELGGDRAKQQENQEFFNNMGKLGYGPSMSGVANNVRANMNLKPTDY